MDRDVARWGATALDTMADRYIACLAHHRGMCEVADRRLRGLDGLIAPTRPLSAPPVSAFADPQRYGRLARYMAHNTRYANMSGLCATSGPNSRSTSCCRPGGPYIRRGATVPAL